MTAVLIIILAVLIIMFITYLLAAGANRNNQCKKSKEESKEDLEKKIKNLEDDIKWCYILLVICAFAITLGAIVTYSKIKEFADIITSFN